MVGVGDDDVLGPPKALQVLPVVIGHRHGIDHHIALRAHPAETVEINIAVLVENGPVKEIRTMQLFHDSFAGLGVGEFSATHEGAKLMNRIRFVILKIL